MTRHRKREHVSECVYKDVLCFDSEVLHICSPDQFKQAAMLCPVVMCVY